MHTNLRPLGLLLATLLLAACGANGPTPMPSPAGPEPTPPPSATVAAPTPIVTPVPEEPGEAALARRQLSAEEVTARLAAWRAEGFATYEWTVSFGCECLLNGPVKVTVRDGQVASAIGPNGALEQDAISAFPLTVIALLERMQAAFAEGGTVTASFDGPGWMAVPVDVTLDPIPNAIDDELTINVQKFNGPMG